MLPKIQIHEDLSDDEKNPNMAPILNLCEAIKMDLHFLTTKKNAEVDKLVLNT